MKLRFIVVLIVFTFFMMALADFCIPCASFVYAQGEDEEEDEEPIQARPDPTQSYSKGAINIQKGSIRGASAKSKSASVGASSKVAVEDTQGPGGKINLEQKDVLNAGASATSAQQAVGSASWDPFDMPAGLDPSDSEVNINSDQMQNMPIDPYGSNANMPIDPLGSNVAMPPDPLDSNTNMPVDPYDSNVNMPIDPLGSNVAMPPDPLESNEMN